MKSPNKQFVTTLFTQSALGKKALFHSLQVLGGDNHFNYRITTSAGEYVMRIGNPRGLSTSTSFNIHGEYKILKHIRRFNIGPKPFYLAGGKVPFLIEEYMKGVLFNSFNQLSPQKILEAIRLMQRVEKVPIPSWRLPSHSYSTYETSIKGWFWRLKEINRLGHGSAIIKKAVLRFRPLLVLGEKILRSHEKILHNVAPVFIYNDVHGANMIWLSDKKQAVFVDWQKVAKGDPAFMPAVFALAFESRSGMKRRSFFRHVIRLYRPHDRSFEQLFFLRILEREIANMLWVVWAKLKKHEALPFRAVEQYDRFVRTRNLIFDFPRVLS